MWYSKGRDGRWRRIHEHVAWMMLSVMSDPDNRWRAEGECIAYVGCLPISTTF